MVMRLFQDWLGPLNDPALDLPLRALVILLYLLGAIHVPKATLKFAIPLVEWIADEVYDLWELGAKLREAAMPWRRHPPPRAPEAIQPPATPPAPPLPPPSPAKSHFSHARRSTIRELRAFSSSLARHPGLRRRESLSAEVRK